MIAPRFTDLTVPLSWLRALRSTSLLSSMAFRRYAVSRCLPLLMGEVRAGDRLETRRDVAELCLAELAGEMLPDPTEVSPGGSPQPLQPLIGEARLHHPGVLGVCLATDEPFRDQPIDEPRQTAGREEHPLGQVRHAQGSARCAGQPEKDVIGGEREVVLPAKLAIELPDDLVIGVEEGLPRSHLRLGEATGSHLPRVASRNLHVQGSY
jgi:hypothetical protein